VHRRLARAPADPAVTVRNVDDLTDYVCPVGDLPPHDDREFASLLESVRAVGITDALFATPNGRVVDGKARLRIARTLGFATVPVRILSAEDELLYAESRLRWNAARRNLSASAWQRIDSILLPALAQMRSAGVRTSAERGRPRTLTVQTAASAQHLRRPRRAGRER